MKKYYFLAALAATALASCTNDDFVGDVGVDPTQPQDAPIVFNSLKGNFTRADITGADAADLLNKKFVVTGYKGSQTTWNASTNKIVFDNYSVMWGENTANTTASNSSNWDYVGKDRIKHAIDKGITSQTIKYWDYSTDQYDFIAWSAGKKTAIFEEPSTGIPEGSVLVTAIDPTTATGASGAAYTFKGKAADLTDCYIADLVTVKKSDYNKPVTLTFRALGSKVRIGIYETIPGYSVKNVKFYSAANTDLLDENVSGNAAKNAKPKLFTTVDNDIFTEGTYTIYYPHVDKTATDDDYADNNLAHIKFTGTGTQSTTVEFGALNNVIAEQGEGSRDAIYLGRSSSTASYAGEAEGNYYTAYLPNEGGTNLNLRVDYTLESIDGSEEEILVRGATAQVPLIYNQWKPGYAYTYLFKISDKTNGYTGVYDPTQPDNVTVNSDPAGLYPITFDAVIVNAQEDATQETITTVSAPSITTYQKGSTVINANEYTVLTTDGDIYVTVNDGNSANTPNLANGAVQTLKVALGTDPETYWTKAKLYTIPAGKTEAEVLDALTMQDDVIPSGVTIKGRNDIELTEASLTLTDKVEYGVDGNVIMVAANKVAKFTPVANTTYAFVYEKKLSNNTTDKFEPVTKAAGASVKDLYHYAYKNAGSGDVQKDGTYFTRTGDGSAENPYVYASHTAFLGQTVNNLYKVVDSKNVPASGYAVTGTGYMYTTDGQNFVATQAVAYADFATTVLYTFDGSAYTIKTETEPAANTAYYYKSGDSYLYCVIYPEQKTNLFVLDEDAAKVACKETETAINGQVYFDRYTQNNGVYYAKVIKVQ